MTIKINWVLNNKLAVGPAPRKKEDLNKLKNNQIILFLRLAMKGLKLLLNQLKQNMIKF